MLHDAAPDLWHHRDFLKLWFGQTVSGVGSRFTGLALPFVAIIALGSTPTQIGLLTAASGLPWLLFGPFIGVGIDRVRRRWILISADLGRGLLLVVIPLLALLGGLRIEYLYMIAFLQGFLTAWFETAYQSYLPTLIPRTLLIDGNSKLNISSSAADVVGPSLAGVVIQAFSAPIAIAFDAGSFLVSTLSIWRIRTPEPAPGAAMQQAVLGVLREGISYIWHTRILRAFAGTNATFMACIGMAQAVLLLFLTSQLHLSPGAIGLMFGVGSVGGLAGAIVATKVSARLTVGPTIMIASLLRGLGFAGIPLALLAPTIAVPLVVITAYAIHQFGWSIWAVTQSSVRQSLAPNRLQGRVTASFLFLVRGAMPLGALLGGVLGDSIGVTPTCMLAAVGLLISTLWLVFSPVRSLREPPLQPEDFPEQPRVDSY